METSTNSGRRWNEGGDTLLFIGFLSLIAWIPIPLGSNRAWAWSLMEVWAYGLVGIWLIMQAVRPKRLPSALRSARWSLLFLGLWLAYTLLQALPLPAALVSAMNPAAYELYRYALGLDMGESISLSVDRRATLGQFLLAGSYGAIYLLTLLLVTSRARLTLTMTVVMFVGLAEAVYGLFNTLSGTEMIGWMKKEAYLGDVTGTYVNRNHFAGLMEIAIPVAIGLLIAEKNIHHYHPTWGRRLAGVGTALLEARGRLALYIVIMFAALFLSGSRGGSASLIVSVTALL
ncbi:MAG: hypothetical protein HQK87_08465, partial [Nitrospinae bacterium]|nr:hypothetical protein [Nitrospinota bacterium]